ncbi:hypothetical protein PV396_41695 [Streptomyces sp. ME02-8801-2C]|uniref:hypothetical protein n=1 Tax=Streptomyces sp. ME02-8801-2C TaxID=3028680 RepID=UPI0029B87446|nr:hypothetical protein [Streptomyces sp. ME02-8801-2C]MDX3458380.1 hypothetical protein [Streptomyces sp. ME02-8801-2C]
MMVTRPKLAAAAVTAVAALALTGCSGGDSDRAGAEIDATPVAATGSLEHIASEAGCEPVIQIDADELRQAACKTSTYGKFLLLTYATDRGQREWINGAKDYGGFYLLGRKWTAVGDQKVIAKLQGKLGGTTEVGADHHAGAGAEASHSAGHEG